MESFKKIAGNIISRIIKEAEPQKKVPPSVKNMIQKAKSPEAKKKLYDNYIKKLKTKPDFKREVHNFKGMERKQQQDYMRRNPDFVEKLVKQFGGKNGIPTEEEFKNRQEKSNFEPHTEEETKLVTKKNKEVSRYVHNEIEDAINDLHAKGDRGQARELQRQRSDTQSKGDESSSFKNEAPKIDRDIKQLWQSGKRDEARKLQRQRMPRD